MVVKPIPNGVTIAPILKQSCIHILLEAYKGRFWLYLLTTSVVAGLLGIIFITIATSPRARVNVVQVCALAFFAAIGAKLRAKSRRDDEIARKSDVGLPIFGFIAAAVAWTAVLWVGYVSDDFTHLMTAHNGSLATLWDALVVGENGTFLRPMGYAAILAEQALFGPVAPISHLSNLAIHASSVYALYLLLRYFCVGRNAALVSAGIFAIMPVEVEAVTWMGARFDLLALCFGLWSAICYVRSQKDRRLIFYPLGLLLLACSLLSKESMFLLPVVLLGADVVIKRRFDAWIGGYFLLAGSLFIFRSWVLGGVGGYNVDGAPSVLNFQLTSMGGVVRGVSQVYLGLNWSVQPRSAVVLASVLLSLLSMVFYCTRLSEDLTRRLVIFGMVWGLVSMAPVHFLLMVGPDLSGSRVLYAPSIGFAIILGQMVAGLPHAALRTLAWLLLVGMMALGTFHNIVAWQQASDDTAIFLTQLRGVAPSPAAGTAFVFKGLPVNENGVPFLAAGFTQAVRLAYHRDDICAVREGEVVPTTVSDQVVLRWDSQTKTLYQY
jgi:hypothetical protein